MATIPVTVAEGVTSPLRVQMPLHLAVLRAVSLWAPGRRSAQRRLYHVYTAGVVALLAALVVGQVLAARYFWGDLLSVAMNTCVVFTYVSAALKAITFVTLRQFADTLIEDINIGLETFGESCRQEKEAVYAACARQSRLLMCVFVGKVGVAHAYWLALPATKMAACQTTDCRIKEGLPTVVWFPFPFTESPFYEVTYVFVSLALFYGYIVTTMVDSFFHALIIYNTGQLRVLNLLAARVCDPEPGAKACSEQQMLQRMAELVQGHTHVDRCVQRLSALLGPILLGQFLSNIASISITAFVATVMKADSQWLVKFGSYLYVVAEETLIYCWLGDNVLTESARLQTSAYSSDWTGAPRSLRRQLPIVLSRAHRPLLLTASKFYTISRETFLLMMNASFSYYAVLRQINGD